MPETQYVQVKPENCRQVELGPTPCYKLLLGKGISCKLICPKHLAEEKDASVAQAMLHQGVCFMDLAYPGTMDLLECAIAEGGKYVLTPDGFVEC